MNHRTPSTLLVVAAILLAASSPVRAARVLDHYDLDSLVHLSVVIVRGQIGKSETVRTRDGDCRVDEVNIVEVFKGNLVAGENVRVTGLDVYRQGPGIIGRADDPRRMIGSGDEVYVFLVPNGKRGYAKYRLTDADWTVIESGCRLVAGGSVYAFKQKFEGMGGGGFIAMTAATFPGTAVATKAEFEDALRTAMDRVKKLGPILDEDSPADPARRDEYVRLLRERREVTRREKTWSDEIGSLIAVKVKQTADPDQLWQLRQDASMFPGLVLEDGLQSGKGRDYLLRRAADTHEPMDVRRSAADLLSRAGWRYHEDLQVGHARPGFVTALARVALANLNGPSADPLLSGVRDCAPPASSRSAPSAALASDLDDAGALLAEAYEGARPADRFRIAEALMVVAPARYRKTVPGAGPMLTLIEHDDGFAEGLARRELRITCTFRSQISKLTPPVQLRLVLRSAESKAETEIPVPSELTLPGRESGGGWGFKVNVPAEVPRGRYHVFFRARSEGNPIADGIGFDVDLPGS